MLRIDLSRKLHVPSSIVGNSVQSRVRIHAVCTVDSTVSTGGRQVQVGGLDWTTGSEQGGCPAESVQSRWRAQDKVRRVFILCDCFFLYV